MVNGSPTPGDGGSAPRRRGHGEPGDVMMSYNKAADGTVLHVVGQRGEVVIAKEIRDSLGIAPGWVARQRIVDDHVEIRFSPPEHVGSLKGKLAPWVTRPIPTSTEFAGARDQAWRDAAQDRWSSRKRGDSPGQMG